MKFGDIIEQAVSSSSDSGKRTASGSVSGSAVKLTKENYRPSVGEGTWRVTVHVNGDKSPKREVSQLTESEATKRFEQLKDKHNLVEGFTTL